MEHLRERQKIKRRIYSRPVQIILLIVLILLARSTWKIYQKNQEAKDNLMRAEEELSALQLSSAELTEKIEDLESERGRDREIREKFGMTKDGEDAVIIVRGKNGAATSTESVKRSFFGQIWHNFLTFVHIR